jgi:hypothetical protein
MGIHIDRPWTVCYPRSTVFAAFKTELHQKLVHLAIFERGDRYDHSDGVAYSFPAIKWYTGEGEVKELYDALAAHDDPAGNNHLIIEACHDYPESTDGDSGSWCDNPWNARRVVTVGINFDYDVD